MCFDMVDDDELSEDSDDAGEMELEDDDDDKSAFKFTIKV